MDFRSSALQPTVPFIRRAHRQPPIATDPDGNFAARTNPDIDVQRMSHFALGTFGKRRFTLAVGQIPGTVWRRHPYVAPGRYRLPQNIAPNDNHVSARCCSDHNDPAMKPHHGCHTYLSRASVLLFSERGKQIPNSMKNLCFSTQRRRHFIFCF